jgi:hypothetical protein
LGKFWWTWKLKMLEHFMAIRHIVHITEIWYILWRFVYFGIIFPVLVYCIKKNLAILTVKCRSLCSGCCGHCIFYTRESILSPVFIQACITGI